MDPKARILIADGLPGQKFLVNALTGYELVHALEYDQAVSLLDTEAPDLVICGVLFDESRMVALFNHFRKLPQYTDVPFLPFRAEHTEYPRMLKDLTAALQKTLGLGSYIEPDWSLSATESQWQVRQKVEQCLPPHKRINIAKETVMRSLLESPPATDGTRLDKRFRRQSKETDTLSGEHEQSNALLTNENSSGLDITLFPPK